MQGFEQRGQRRLDRLQQQMSQARRRAPHATLEPDELQRFPLLVELSPEERDELLPLFRPRSAQPGERIFRAGDRADALYFIAEGRVEVELPESRASSSGPARSSARWAC